MSPLWRQNLSLTKMGLLLVCIPLAIGLIFIGTLSVLLNKSQLETERHLRSKAIVSQSNMVSRLFLDASLAMSSYSMTGVVNYSDQYAKTRKILYDEVCKLQALKVNDEKERDLIEALTSKATEGMKVLDSARLQIDNVGMSNSMFKQIRSVAGALDPSMQELQAFENSAEVQSTSAQSGATGVVHYALIIGAVLNISASLCALLFFRKIVTSRLGVMRENSYRLTRREELSPALEGTDEIADLDKAFHDMANALTEANRKERALVENAVEVICSIDERGVISEVNPAANALWEYEPEELLGQRIINLVAESDKEETTTKFQEARTNKGMTKFENKTVAKSGKIVDVLWAVSWSPTDNSLYCVIHDVSERKKLEQLKREFIQMVSHDLRVPLTSLQMTLDLLLNGMYGELTEKGRPRIQHAMSELERLINLINQLLEFERMESGKVEIFSEPTEISEVVTRSVEAVRSLAERSKVSLATDVFAIEIPADGAKLIQVLVNLLGNAIKFSPQNTTVSATMEMFEKYVEIRISDQGRGIPKEFCDKIFDRFEQVSIDDNRVKGGSGLGLAISKSIVVAHNGTIGVDSEEGVGSTFWIRLPFV